MATARPDYYAVLGVPRSATPQEIRRAYRARAFNVHPDRAGDDPAARAEFDRLTEAYAVLFDPEQRRRYDSGGDIVLLGASAAGEVARREFDAVVRGGLCNLHRARARERNS